MPYVESRRSGIIVSPPSEMKVCLCLLTLHAGIARTRKRGAAESLARRTARVILEET